MRLAEPRLAARVGVFMVACSRPLSVLVVEDCRDGAQTLAVLLRLFGHAPTVAYDGEEGLAAAERCQPDVIVADIGLPRMDGLELARRLARRSPTPLLVAVSGFGRDADRAAALRAGYHFHLVKPVEPDRLRALLAEHAARLAPCAAS